MTAPTTFRFLNIERSLDECGWHASGMEKLWAYNLHYFSDLVASRAVERADWHRALLQRWVRENAPGRGDGWEPYPTSLRIVNWIKWAMAGNELSAECLQSLAVQARWLAKRLEWHLLGNHLFVNAKALVFAGLYFRGVEADRWLRTGLTILATQVPIQILPDGGQFERSPMYHALALEDFLDLVNVLRAASDAIPRDLRHSVEVFSARIPAMRHWLEVMCHPDGEISFFNDAAIGVAPAPAQLDEYAQRLGFGALTPLADGVVQLESSGYIRVQRGSMVALLDVARIGPDELPGHAHADTLSFELSLDDTRVLVNSGTSCYGGGAERLRQRGTAAHTTVVLNDADSSEVWGGFRVARRARPFNLSVAVRADDLLIAASHDGYSRLRGSPIHRRQWRFAKNELTVTDTISGMAKARSMWHFGADIAITGTSTFDGRLSSGRSFRFEVAGALPRLLESTLHPKFGCDVAATLIICDFTGAASSARIAWS